MKKYIFLTLTSCCLVIFADQATIKTQFLLAQTDSFLTALYKNFVGETTVTAWYARAKDYDVSLPKKPITPILAFKKNLEECNKFQKTVLGADSLWLNKKINLDETALKRNRTLQPFVLKYTAQPGNHIYFWGDLHGDIRNLAGALYDLYTQKVIDNNLKILDPNSVFFFLGDLTDRGQHGPDTLALLTLLVKKNPLQVFMIRGNHEDHSIYMRYGLAEQMVQYLKNMSEEFNYEMFSLIDSLYNTLPVAAFVGCNNNYIQCCHGGFEIRYNPKKLLAKKTASVCFEQITQLTQPEEIYQTLNIDPAVPDALNTFITISNDISPSAVGFLWNDFQIPEKEITECTPGRGIKVGSIFTREILKLYSSDAIKVRAIIRGHQHNGSMLEMLKNPQNSGVYALMNDTVFTTIGTSIYTGIQAYCECILSDNFNNWQLIAHYLTPPFIQVPWPTRKGNLSSWKNSAP